MWFVLRRFRGQRGSLPTTEDTDGELIDLARGGDLDAFNILVDRYQGPVYSVALRYMRSPDLADDVTQDTFIRAYNALDTFRNNEGKGFRSWLLRIASNRALDVLRASARRPADSLEAMLDNENSAWSPEDPSETPDERADRGAVHREIERALGELREDQRLVVILFDIEGYSYEEIAEIADVAVGTVKSRLHRGRARLREVLLDRPDGRELFEGVVRLPSDADSG
ncbi:MAG: RNA polymerase sigma factor [Chloroflexota bacterium]